MLFTVGHREGYEMAFAELDDKVEKLGAEDYALKNLPPDFPGGSVWETHAEATAAIADQPDFAVWGLDATLDDCHTVDGKLHLRRSRPVLRLNV